MLAYAYEGLPIVIMAESGGAATAIFDYCRDGIQAVDSDFVGDELALRVIKQLNDKYEQNQLNFFQLDVRRLGSKPPSKSPNLRCAPCPCPFERNQSLQRQSRRPIVARVCAGQCG